jgi:phage terminase large subunit
MAIWVAEFVGREIRLLDYIEGVGQPLAYYATELRRRRWKDAIICLPHDGVAANNISGKRYIDHWIEAGFECGPLIKNTGAGAAMMRIEVARRVFPRCWFNETTTEAGRDALGYYHERRDENRNVGLGPEQTGPLMPQTVLAIWLSAMKSRR